MSSTNIVFHDSLRPSQTHLVPLFESVGWESARLPQKLEAAVAASHSVLSAWDGETLVGLINALSDGHMAAYFHYLLVHPRYQGQGIGKGLLERMLQRYAELPVRFLVAYHSAVPFYQACGLGGKDDRVVLYFPG